jgi:CDP-diacylglycerol--glycerol-3-phosphate 3-phosphatidyltransferase
MDYQQGWSRLHGGHHPNGLVSRWLAAVHPAARVLARHRVSPDSITLVALLLAVAAVPPARAGGFWTLLAAALVLLSAIGDGLDGAVAVLSGRASRVGAIADSAGDRLAEAAFAVALWAAGTPGWLVATAAGLWWLHEYLRARAAAVGLRGIGVVTVGERPIRVIMVIIGLVAAWPLGPVGPALATGAAAALGIAGIAQLVPWLRRADLPGDDRGGECDQG